MTCPSGEIWTAYADDEPPRAELQELEAHLAGCPDCRSLVLALREENRLLVRALEEILDAGKQRPVGLLGVTVAVGTLAALAAGLHLASDWLAGLGREAPVGLVDERRIVLGLLFETVFYLLREGASMLESIVGTVVVPALIVLGGLVALSQRRRWAGGALALCAILTAGAPSQALEVRGSHSERDRVVVGAGEIVDDSLAVAGDVVTVDGTVTGDLFAAGHRVILRGTVKGDLMAVAERVEIEGTVEGNVFVGGETLLRPRVRRPERARRRRNGPGRPLGTRGRRHRRLRRDDRSRRPCRARPRRLCRHDERARRRRPQRLGPDAPPASRRSGKDRRQRRGARPRRGCRAGGRRSDRLGEDRDTTPSEGEEPLHPCGFYVWKLIWLAAAFVVGLALHALLPGLFPARLPGSVALLRAAGLGFVALVVVPAAALLLMLTLIGLPAGLLILGLWLAGLYVAQSWSRRWSGAVSCRRPIARPPPWHPCCSWGSCSWRSRSTFPTWGDSCASSSSCSASGLP